MSETKVIPLNDPNVAKIRKETTKVAGVIEREMKALQKNFPDYFFELSFERQPLGKQNFYRIHLKTFKNG